MPSLSEEVTIPSPIAAVWPLLADPALVATCVSGAGLAPTDVNGVYQGTLRIKFGPTVAVFRGEARIAYHPDTLSCTVEARGIDRSGRSRASASGSVHVSGGKETLVRVEGSFTVSGPLEALAHAGGTAAARTLLAEFARNLVKLLTTEGDPAPEADSIPLIEPQTAAQQARALAAGTDPAAEPRVGQPSWRGPLGWLKQVFARQ
jgi:carbon monoxide dehydrogenase subunit G